MTKEKTTDFERVLKVIENLTCVDHLIGCENYINLFCKKHNDQDIKQFLLLLMFAKNKSHL